IAPHRRHTPPVERLRRLARLDVAARSAEGDGGAVGAGGDDLAEYRDRPLLRGAAADVEAAGGVDAGGLLVRGAPRAEALVALLGRAAAAERADVAGVGRQGALERGDVQAGVVGEDEHDVARAERPAPVRRLRPADLHARRAREARRAGERLARVADR